MLPEMMFCAVYRAHQNEVLEYLVARLRSKQFGQAIPKDNIRGMIRSLKQGSSVWYAQDQSYSGKGSLSIPFFGVDAATNSGTSRIAKITGASIVPFFTVRTADKEKRYLLRFLPPLDNFPSTDAVADTLRINQLIEAEVRKYPEQYLWTHKRYKTASHDFYNDYAQQHTESGCK
jgi:KDO2-lipid IV(A) lauroyltransferase